MPDSTQTGSVWIGVDGGATKFALHRIEVDARGSLVTVGGGLERAWPIEPDTDVVDLARQRAELDAGQLVLRAHEEACSRAWPRVLAHALAELAAGAPIVLGICMPGRKCSARRGVVVMANGPRLPRFADDLERELESAGVTLAQPLVRLESDGQAAGWGEELAEHGHFAEVRDAVLVGLGTGLAEAVKLAGRHLSAAEIEALHSPAHARSLVSLAPELLLPWEDPRQSVEGAASLGGMQRAFAERARGGAWLTAARGGDGLARELLRRGAVALASFLVERVQALEATGAREVRVVLGQRAALLEGDQELTSCWGLPLREELERGGVASGALRVSELRAAPAIGALGAALGRVE